ncbi:MAG: ATP-binding protein [Rhizomicrobium sp.]|jgi:two-component system phosphate regulon sensor histidine kinase PhoR
MALPLPHVSDIAIAAVVLCCGLAILVGGKKNEESRIASASGVHGTGGVIPTRIADVLERLPDPFMLLDESERVIFVNRAMVAVIGTDTQRKHVSSVLRTPAVLQSVQKTAATGEPTSVEFSIPVPVERHYLAYITRTDQSPRWTALLLHDVTAAKRAEEARADFVANASHELRTPLAAVSGFIDTLKGHARDDESARERFLEIMSVEANRMRRLIDDLLSLTRIEQNEHVPPSGDVDIADVLREAATALQGLAQLDNVTITLSEAQGLPLIAGERDELVQLFQNLIHNAIKYGRVGGHVWISFAHAPGSVALQGRRNAGAMVSVTIRDDGEGIPREAIPRLTERFYRVDVKRSRERGGTGLGLAIVKHIVNRHKGKLSIESKSGEGSTFTVLLPAAAPCDTPAPAAGSRRDMAGVG